MHCATWRRTCGEGPDPSPVRRLAQAGKPPRHPHRLQRRPVAAATGMGVHMTRIAFIGLGNMGGGMAARQVAGGREVHAFDLSEAAIKKVTAQGAHPAGSVAKAVEGADAVITMLPAGPHVRKVYDEHI